MAVFNANMLIKESRKASGLSQIQVAEGICSRQTISAIERGERKPDWFTFSNIMRKLNLDPTEYYNDVVGKDEIYIYNQVSLANQLLKSFDFDGLKAEVEKMEQDERFANGLGYQVLLSFRCNLYSKGPYVNTKLALDYAFEYMKIFRPDFEIEKIPTYFLSANDIRIINIFSNAYHSLGEIEKSIQISYMLLDNLAKNYYANIDNILKVTRVNVTNNLVQKLLAVATETKSLERFEECIQVANKGLAMLKGLNDNIVTYFRLLYCKAYALMCLGRKDEAGLLMKRCILFSHAMGEDIPFDMAVDFKKSDLEKNFGYKLEIAVLH